MKTFTRKISHEEAQGILLFCGSVIGSVDSGTKVVLVKLQKKFTSIFEVETLDFEERKEAAIKAGEGSIPWIASDKIKKDVELKHIEISSIATSFLEFFKKVDVSFADASTVLKLAGEDCLLIHKWIDKNVKLDEMKLIEVEEDECLVPEDN